ncbi:MAG TPA: tetratricopeptide repeat protein [Kofleriaceae bacterium]|nr:tetratricopeptide repeat protein [Kofleriaceae bacterium]
MAIVRGSEMLKQGKLDQAQRVFRAALEIEPDNTKVLALLGLTYFRGNEFAAARSIYEELVRRSPTDASHRLNLGLVYLKLNDAEQAIDALEASRALDPSQGRAVSYLGLAYARAGRYAEAYRAFLLAGQNELASEIESNLSDAERDGIQAQLGRTPAGPMPTLARPEPAAAEPPAPAPAPAPAPPTARAMTPPPVEEFDEPRPKPDPRTKPPSAPPKGRAATFRPEPVRRVSTVEIGARRDVPRDADESSIESSPDITIERASDPGIAVSEPAREEPPVAGAAPQPMPAVAAGAAPQPMTVSQQFVLPQPDPAAPQPVDGHSMVSMAVAAAAPAPAAAARTPAGGFAARPLSELATEDLVRPDDGTDAFEIAPNGTLIVRVADRVMTRLDGVHITGGTLAYEIAMRRSRGHQTDERFDAGGSPLHAVSGKGYLIAVPGKDMFVAIALDDDILYVREDLVYAFESSLRWENGNVPGLRGKLHVVQFRGDGALALRLSRPLVRVKLPPQGLVFVDAERLAGWIGRVIPRAVVPPVGGPMGAMCVECTGEGIVLVEPAEGTAVAPSAIVAAVPAPPPPPKSDATPAPPPELADFAAALQDAVGEDAPDSPAGTDDRDEF